MCNPGLIAVALLAGGAGATAIGQRKGAKEAKKVMHREEAFQKGLRKKSLAAAEELVNQNDPKAWAADIAAPQATVGDELAKAETVARVAQASTPAHAAEGQVFQGAVADARRGAQPLAMRQGFNQALDERDRELEALSQVNLFLGEDSRRSLAGLPGRLSRAGRKGHGWRTAGKIGTMAGSAVAGGGMWAPAAAALPMVTGDPLNGTDYGGLYRRNRPPNQAQV